METGDFTIQHTDSRIEYPFHNEHFHERYELDFFIDADIQLFIKDKKYEISGGDMLLINPNEIHKIIYRKNLHYNRYVMNFKGSVLDKLLSALGLPDFLGNFLNCGCKLGLDEDTRKIITHQFETLIAASQCGDILSDGVIATTLFNILWEFISLQQTGRHNPLKGNEQIVAKMINYIDMNYAKEINLDILCGRFYLSKCYISRMFKKNTGFTVVEYINQKRILEAARMLRETDKDIMDICFDAGFASLQNFYLVFKGITGTTPYKFRKLCV